MNCATASTKIWARLALIGALQSPCDMPNIVLTVKSQALLDAITKSRLETEKANQDKFRAEAQALAEQAKQHGEVAVAQARIQEEATTTKPYASTFRSISQLPREAGVLPGRARHLQLRRFPHDRFSRQPGGTSTSTTPLLFYSRRIGLNANASAHGPRRAGTGKVGKFSLGLLNITTSDDDVSRMPQTNFSVVRVKRDVFRRSAVGAMVTNRTESAAKPDA